MGHTIEPAASGRARCRGCGKTIAKGELRLGARLPNPFVEGELTLWFHLVCGTYKRPQPYLDAAADTKETIENAEWLEAEAKRSLEHILSIVKTRPLAKSTNYADEPAPGHTSLAVEIPPRNGQTPPLCSIFSYS